MWEETIGFSLPNAFNNIWIQNNFGQKYFKVEIRNVLNILHFVEAGRGTEDLCEHHHWEADSWECLFPETAAIWCGLLLAGSNTWSTWKDLGELEGRQRKRWKGLAAQTRGNFQAVWTEVEDFQSHYLILQLPMAALCSHIGMCMSQEVQLDQKCFFVPSCAEKHCEANILQSDKSFMTGHIFCSCFLFLACILIERPLCELGEWLILASNYRKRIRLESQDLVFRQLPCINK